MVASWTPDGDSAFVPPLLAQPVDVDAAAAARGQTPNGGRDSPVTVPFGV